MANLVEMYPMTRFHPYRWHPELLEQERQKYGESLGPFDLFCRESVDEHLSQAEQSRLMAREYLRASKLCLQLLGPHTHR